MLLADLMQRELPQGIAVKDASTRWSEDRMHFSFKAKKSFFSVPISGVVQVTDEWVVMDTELPGLVLTFVSEDQIRNVINRELDHLFPEQPKP
jgi:hypothetical protein